MAASAKPKKSTSDARDRVTRALSIYSKINKQRSEEAVLQREKREQIAQLERECNQMKDQLRQFKHNIRWYQLDDQGNRVYMKKDDVKKQKQVLRDSIQQHCQ